MPDVYMGLSHSELHEFLRQCVEYLSVAKASLDDPGTMSFVATFFRGKTTGPTWSDYQKSLAPGHVVTWNEFKRVLRSDLGDEDAFINKTWSKWFTYHQRSGESVQTFSVTLQELRAILLKYDSASAPTDSMMIRRICHALRPEIRAALYNTGERVESFTTFLNKAMSAEASAGMQSSAKNVKARN